MLRYKTETRPGLVALYDIRPGNGAGQFLTTPEPPRGTRVSRPWHGLEITTLPKLAKKLQHCFGIVAEIAATTGSVHRIEIDCDKDRRIQRNGGVSALQLWTPKTLFSSSRWLIVPKLVAQCQKNEKLCHHSKQTEDFVFFTSTFGIVLDYSQVFP